MHHYFCKTVVLKLNDIKKTELDWICAILSLSVTVLHIIRCKLFGKQNTFMSQKTSTLQWVFISFKFIFPTQLQVLTIYTTNITFE